jgi:FKBP-type peptidyl-prolyl cis-trans isomerase FklB
MKLRWVAMVTLLLFAASAAAEGTPQGKELKEKKDRLSYSIGMDIGNTLKHQPFEVDLELLMQGIRDVFSGTKTLLTEEEQTQALTELQKDLEAKQKERVRQMMEKNKKEGEEFLAANAKKEGVVTLPSGLQYKVLKSGTGPSPKLTDTVEANYRRTLFDGTEVDSSYKRGKTAVFPLQTVIAGWKEAFQKMKVGDKWQLFVPSELAFGERGNRDIEPNQALIFEVELVGIQK